MRTQNTWTSPCPTISKSLHTPTKLQNILTPREIEKIKETLRNYIPPKPKCWAYAIHLGLEQ